MILSKTFFLRQPVFWKFLSPDTAPWAVRSMRGGAVWWLFALLTEQPGHHHQHQHKNLHVDGILGKFGTPSLSVCGLCFSLSISFTVDNSVDHLCLSLYLILSSVLFLLPCLFSSLLIEYSSFLSLAHIRFFQQFLLYSQFLIFGCSHNCDISLFYWWFFFFCEDCSILFFVCFFVQDHCKVMPCKLR